jgi:SET domain-containing protein
MHLLIAGVFCYIDSMNETNEFSFLLKPSEHGIGVFAAHYINKGAHLKLFGLEDTLALRSLERDKDSVPEIFQQYCINRGDKLICPKDFTTMPVGWYLNHSTDPNTFRDDDYKWYASTDIKAGEEILINYNLLEEPKEAQEDYYKL